MTFPDPYDRTDYKSEAWADELEERADVAREVGQ